MPPRPFRPRRLASMPPRRRPLRRCRSIRAPLRRLAGHPQAFAAIARNPSAFASFAKQLRSAFKAAAAQPVGNVGDVARRQRVPGAVGMTPRRCRRSSRDANAFSAIATNADAFKALVAKCQTPCRWRQDGSAQCLLHANARPGQCRRTARWRRRWRSMPAAFNAMSVQPQALLAVARHPQRLCGLGRHPAAFAAIAGNPKHLRSYAKQCQRVQGGGGQPVGDVGDVARRHRVPGAVAMTPARCQRIGRPMPTRSVRSRRTPTRSARLPAIAKAFNAAANVNALNAMAANAAAFEGAVSQCQRAGLGGSGGPGVQCRVGGGQPGRQGPVQCPGDAGDVGQPGRPLRRCRPTRRHCAAIANNAKALQALSANANAFNALKGMQRLPGAGGQPVVCSGDAGCQFRGQPIEPIAVPGRVAARKGGDDRGKRAPRPALGKAVDCDLPWQRRERGMGSGSAGTLAPAARIRRRSRRCRRTGPEAEPPVAGPAR